MDSTQIMGNKGVVWSLFCGSGIMGLPWAEAGYEVFCFNSDDGDHGDYEVKMRHPNMTYVNFWIDENFDPEGFYLDLCHPIGKPDIIFAFPPCTDLAVSGAAHFKKKAEKDPLFQEKAVNTAKVAAKLANKYNCPYMIENPVSVLSSKWRKPDHIFHPYEYGGYLPEDDVNPFFPEYINARDAYPKKTCLWVGNGFKMPVKMPVPIDDGYSTQHQKLGGKSTKTKLIRSLTPRGFARAVYIKNN